MKRLEQKSVQCEYKGYLMRSYLEKKIAMKLDELRVRWFYEPQGFIMNDGTCYLPDFYLPDQKIWIEGKGIMSEVDEHKCDCFVQENESNEPLLIVFPDGQIEIMGAFKSWGDDPQGNLQTGYKRFRSCDFEELNKCEYFDLVRCRKCGRFYVQSQADTYACLFCEAWDGDHLRESKIQNGENFFSLREDIFQ